MDLRLLLIRHAETEPGRKRLLVGANDVDAAPDALLKLDRFRDVLAPYPSLQCYCSPMKRTVQTASRIKQACNLSCEISLDKRLREIDFGRWEMQSVADISRKEPGLIEAWSEYESFTFPEGEAVRDFCGRVADALAALQRMPVKDVLVITHGGVIRTMICLALGHSVRDYLLYNVKPGSLTVLDMYSDGGVLTGLNL